MSRSDQDIFVELWIPFIYSTCIFGMGSDMKRSSRVAVAVLFIMVLLFPGMIDTGSGDEEKDDIFEKVYDELVREPIFDQVVEVPPGGETRIYINETGAPTVQGYKGFSSLRYGKLGEAVDLLPLWLQEPFIKNMLRAGSKPVDIPGGAKPTFGDVDGDGDDDMLIAYGTNLRYYENIGWDGNPIFIEGGMEDELNYFLSFQEGDWLCPLLYDIDGDGFSDFIFSDSQSLVIFRNPGIDEGVWIMDILTMPAVYDLSPTVLENILVTDPDHRDYYELTFACGDEGGIVRTITISIYSEFSGVSFMGSKYKLSGIIPMVNYTAPRAYRSPWTYSNYGHEEFPDLMIGSGDGNIIHYGFVRVDGKTLVYDKRDSMLSISNHKGPITPGLIDMDGDLHHDLILGTGEEKLPTYMDLGSIYYPYWKPMPIVPLFEIENYRSSFNNVLTVYDEESVSGYLESIIYPQDTRYRDEIGFSCAYTPPEQMRNDRLSTLFVQNARYIYSRSGDLGYVRLMEYPGDDYHTTTEYRVREGDDTRWMTTPRDGYYWGVVHPRVTEEPVSYIDPETGGERAQENGGRFWREYLWEHADEEYPPGPDYPDDWNGRVAYYPRNSTPPLLKDVLSDVDILWDLMPYEYPGGFDNNGDVNNHPWDFKDHAIEKVSHWVEKTLVLNQQEVTDGERPTQPVRIAHHHNGNCGELQDLTIAAARSALIPARGVMLTGEDHVWSEFYLGGWHQWDNYWSDGGGVIANQLNYWWGWRERGGSGLWAQKGNGQIEDVGDTYRTTDITGRLIVTVTDSDGDPVDGARVMVLSHWAMESINLDVGPYQGPPPVTIPLPSIWGYTDQNGRCELTVWHQNFNIRVTSDMGTYVSEKFNVGDTETVEMVVGLDGEMPRHNMFDSDDTSYSTYNIVSADIVGSVQDQDSFISGNIYDNRMQGGKLIGFTQREWDLGSYQVNDRMDISTTSPYMGLIKRYRGDGGYFVMRNIQTIKTSVFVRVRIYDPIYYDGELTPKFFTINDRGSDYTGFEIYGENTVSGWITDWTFDLDEDNRTINYLFDKLENPRIVGPKGTIPVELIELAGYGKAEIPWIAQDLNGYLGENRFNFIADIEDNGVKKEYNVTFKMHFKDNRAPRWDRLVNETISWGLSTDIGIGLIHTEDRISGVGFLNNEYTWSNPLSSFEETGGYLTWNLNSSDHPGGRRSIRMSIIDDAENIQTAVYSIIFEEISPVFMRISPANGSIVKDDSVIVKGEVSDDVMVSLLTINCLGRTVDITEIIDELGLFEYKLEFGGYRGDVNITLKGSDNVGLVTYSYIELYVDGPPDVTPPSMSITSPTDGKAFIKGDHIRFAGYADDDRSISSLMLISPDGPHDLLKDLDGDRWEAIIKTSTWPLGTNTITVYAEDASGNSHSVRVKVEILTDEVTFVDREDPLMIFDIDMGDEYEFGDEVPIRGMVIDDGDTSECTIGYSIQGLQFVDITESMNEDGRFEWEFNTGEIDRSIIDDPEMLYHLLGDFQLDFMVVDGAGNERIYTLEITIIDTLPPILVDITIKETLDGDISIDLLIGEDTMVTDLVLEVRDYGGLVISRRKLDDRDLRMKGDDFRYTGDMALYGRRGDMKIHITVGDRWGNILETSEGFFIHSDKEDDEGSMLPILLGGAALIMVVFATVYLAVRRSRV